VVDSRLFPEEALDRLQDVAAVPVGGRADVNARRVETRGQRPEVEIVERLDAVDLEDAAAQGSDVDLPRRPFEEDVRRLLEQREGARQDEDRDGDRDRRIEPDPPVLGIVKAATTTATEPTRSVAISRCAARRFRLSSRPRERRRRAATFARSPAEATASITPLATGTGCPKRPNASKRIQPDIRSSSSALTKAARISAR
jgi:hypothetical protein